VIPANFSSGNSVLSLSLAIIAILACSVAAMGGYLASISASPHEDAPAPVTVMLATTQPVPGPSRVEPAAKESVASGEAPGTSPEGSEALASIRGTPSMLLQAPMDWASSAPETSMNPPDSLATASVEDSYEGIWAPERRACSPRLNRKRLLPAVINSDGAWAGDTSCSFTSNKRTGNTWSFAAMCSNSRTNWKTTVNLTVTGNRLTWKSARGTQIYVRCEENLQQADGMPPRV
jgi:hypothetical protein